jgi:hypothetical protein
MRQEFATDYYDSDWAVTRVASELFRLQSEKEIFPLRRSNRVTREGFSPSHSKVRIRILCL